MSFPRFERRLGGIWSEVGIESGGAFSRSLGRLSFAAPAAPACKEAIVENTVVQDVVVAPDENWSAVLTPGQVLRIVDLEGKQAVEFLCYNADDPADRYNAADTMKYNKNAYLGAGHGIYSVCATKLFTIVAASL